MNVLFYFQNTVRNWKMSEVLISFVMFCFFKAKSTDKDNNSSSLPSLLLSNDAKDLHNLRLDYIQAPLNDTEFHELTKSVP